MAANKSVLRSSRRLYAHTVLLRACMQRTTIYNSSRIEDRVMSCLVPAFWCIARCEQRISADKKKLLDWAEPSWLLWSCRHSQMAKLSSVSWEHDRACMLQPPFRSESLTDLWLILQWAGPGSILIRFLEAPYAVGSHWDSNLRKMRLKQPGDCLILVFVIEAQVSNKSKRTSNLKGNESDFKPGGWIDGGQPGWPCLWPAWAALGGSPAWQRPWRRLICSGSWRCPSSPALPSPSSAAVLHQDCELSKQMKS